MAHTEDYLKYQDGSRVRYWLNSKKTGPAMVFVHGLGERIEMYEHLMNAFGRAGISVSLLELRGHGLSSGEHKYVDDFSEYTTDVMRFVMSFFKDRPVYLGGHSTGGMAVLRAATDRRLQARGLVLSSPLVALKINMFQKLVVSLVGRILPHFEIPTGDDGFMKLTHDREMQAMLIEESRRSSMGPKMRFLRSFLVERKHFIHEGGQLAHLPALLMLAEQDDVLDIHEIAAIFENVFPEDLLDLRRLPGCYHAILLEDRRDDYIEMMIDWISRKESG